MAEPIPQEELAAARRRVCRHIAAVIVQAMSETDTSFALMAVRLGKTEKKVRSWLSDLLDGESIPLDRVSDIFWTMGWFVPKLSLVRKEQ